MRRAYRQWSKIQNEAKARPKVDTITLQKGVTTLGSRVEPVDHWRVCVDMIHCMQCVHESDVLLHRSVESQSTYLVVIRDSNSLLKLSQSIETIVRWALETSQQLS